METWTRDTWFGLVVLIWVLLALPLLSRQATDWSVERHHPLMPNRREGAKTSKLTWIWIAGLVLLLVVWQLLR